MVKNIVHNCGGRFFFTHVDQEGMGAYGPLLLAPAEGLGGPLDPLPSGGIFLKKKILFPPEQSIDI